MHRDWAQLDSDSDSSRHNDSEEDRLEDLAPKPVAPVSKPPAQNEKIPEQKEAEESRPPKTESSKPAPRQRKQYDFPTDEQLLTILAANKAGPWMLKIVFSFEYDEDALKELFPKAKVSTSRNPGTYEIQFAQFEDAKEFLETKKVQKLRFKIKDPQKDARFQTREPYSNRRDNKEPYGRPAFANRQKETHEQPKYEKHQRHEKPKKAVQLFHEENKLVFSKQYSPSKLDAGEIVKEINQRDMFKEFSSIVFVAGEEDSQQLFPQVKKLAEEVSKQLGRSIEEGRSGGFKCVKIVELKKPEEVKKAPQPTEPQLSEVYKYTKEPRHQPKADIRLPKIIKDNTILYKVGLIDKVRLFQQLRDSKLIEKFDYLRIKAFPQDIKGARELASSIQKEFSCEETSVFHEQNNVSIVLRRKSEEYIQSNNNTVKVTEKLVVIDAVTEIKKKWNKIIEGFKGVGIEYEQASKVKAQELIRQLGLNGFIELERRVKGEVTKLTFGLQQKKSEAPPPVAADKGKTAQEVASKTSPKPSKEVSKKPESKDLIRLPDSNLVELTKKIDEKQLLQEYESKKQMLFGVFNALRLRTELKQLFQYTSELGKTLSAKCDLVVTESESKTETGTRMDVMLRRKKLQKEAATGKKKCDTTKINEYLDN